MAELLVVIFVALITLGIRLIWLHDISNNSFWHSNWCVAVGLCAVVVGVFGVIFSMGAIFGMNIMEVFA